MGANGFTKWSIILIVPLKDTKQNLLLKVSHNKRALDFTETFSPIAKMATVKTLHAISAMRGWSLTQLDVNIVGNILVINKFWYKK